MFEKIFNDNSLSNLSNIKKINETNKIEGTYKNTKFEEAFLIGITHLKVFLETKNTFNLKRSIYYFTKANKIKKSSAKPYFYLSFIAYISGDILLAKKYYQFVLLLDKNYPDLDKLKNKLMSI